MLSFISMILEQKTKKLIQEYNMIDCKDNILVAFSGGSDSSALLYFLLNHFSENRIYAAHMNHMLRGEEADRDEKFAVETCEKYNIKIFTERRNIPEIAQKSKKSIEESARDERYDFLKKTSGLIGGSVKIATAHTASDNTETVIFNLSRGSGLAGLSGIPPVNKNIIRPFLSCSKEEISEYCENYNIAYVEDKTNSDKNYTRNFIRRSIVSRLKEKFYNIDKNIFNTTEIIRDTMDFLNSCADEIIKNADETGTDVSFLLTRHKSLRRAVLAKLYENAVYPEIKKLEHKHVLYIEELMGKSTGSKKFDKSIDLPGFVTCFISGNKISFAKDRDKKTSENRR